MTQTYFPCLSLLRHNLKKDKALSEKESACIHPKDDRCANGKQWPLDGQLKTTKRRPTCIPYTNILFAYVSLDNVLKEKVTVVHEWE